MTNSSSERPGEFELIAQLFAPLATAAGAFGLTDDVALIAPPPGKELVLKTDAIVEGVHFHASDPAESVAKKALRVNLSDLAAKGAEPAGYLLTLNLPKSASMEWLEGFARGLAADQKEFGILLFGGDTTATPGPLSISVSMFGWIAAGAMTKRAGAKPGDLVFVSGSIGDAGGGLAVLRGEGHALSAATRETLIERYRIPQPRLALGQALRGIASASLDVSDGLLADLGHISDVSKVRIVVEAARVPLSKALQALWGHSNEAIARAASAGDDYEIAFTAPLEKREAVLAAARASGTSVTEIGRVEAGEGIVLLDSGGGHIPVARPGFTHF
ncbi:MAG TPA: thiamine-phosphate kinase [Rhizomicrobium sp.]|nr:thiamine-phosphate kinase [Rhizomicrobium sp.]